MRCRACDRDNRDGRRFCAECGARLVVVCGACGGENEPGERFCGACGAGVDAGAVEGAAQAAKPTAGAPAVRLAMAGERKQVTVLFADVQGSMELAERFDPETWSTIMQGFFAVLAAGVERFEGFVDKFTGDGIMALFGAPIAHEDHAARACRAALHIREALEGHTMKLREQYGVAFSVRMGLNSGEVVVGQIGDDQRMEYTAQGYTVGLASRMEQLAQPGGVLLTEHTAALVTGLFRLDDLGPKPVKGISAPVRAYQLEGLGSLRSRIDELRARRYSKFVGRAREVATLDAALQDAAAGRPRVAGVVAPAGVGKTRLCFEFAERCRANGWRILEVDCPAHQRIIPFQLLQKMLRAAFDVRDADTDTVARGKVEAILREDRDSDAAAIVLEFLGVNAADAAAGHDPEVRQRRLFSVVHRLLVRSALGGPLLLLIDDMQWVDGGSEAFLAEIEAIQGLRALLLVNFRPEYRPPWVEHQAYLSIPLQPLDASAVDELLGHLLGHDPSLGAVKRMIARRTGGNAFFVEEVVQSLVEAGDLAGERGAYRLVRDLDDVRLPATVEVVLAARIDRLPPHAKHALQAAAVIGREFTRPVLAAVTSLPANDLAGALSWLEHADLVHADSDDEYVFNHPLMQEVGYREQLTERREQTHAAVARAIETIATSLEDHYATLAYHWAQSRERERAVDYYARAGDKARAVFSLAMAREQYAQGLAILDALGPTPARLAKRVEMTLALAEAGLHGPTPAQVEALRHARSCAERIGDSGSQHRCTYWIGWLEYALGNVDTALRAFEECIDVATAVGHRGLLAQVYCNLGSTYTEMAEYETALDYFDRGIGMRDGTTQTPDSVVVAYALGLLGVALGDMGRFGEAFARIEEGLAMLERLGRRSVQASVLQTVTWVQLYRGGWSECVQAAGRSRLLAERVGAPYIVETNLSFEGFARIHLEPDGDGLDLLLESTERLERLRAFLSMSVSLGCCAEALAAVGDVRRARIYADRTFERVAAREAQGEVAAHRALLTVAAAAGDRAAMRQHYDAAIGAAARKHSPRDAAITELRFGEALARLGAGDEAHGPLDRAHAAFDRLGMEWYRDAAARTLGHRLPDGPTHASK